MLCLNCHKENPLGMKNCMHCGRELSVSDSSRFLMPDTVLLGKYRICRVLGERDSQVTYLAHDQGLDIHVEVTEYFPVGIAARQSFDAPQLTVIEGKEETFQSGLKNFLREAQNLAQSGNSVRDFFRANGTAYTVMVYAENIVIEPVKPNTKKDNAAAKRSFPLWLPITGGAFIILLVLLLAQPRGEKASVPETVPTLALTAAVISPSPEAEPSAAPIVIPEIPIQTPTPEPKLTRAELAQTNRYTVACGNRHVAYIGQDGDCLSVGSDLYGQRSGIMINGTEVLRQLAAGYAHTVMLFEDGSVRATTLLAPSGEEPYDYGQSDVDGWKNVVQIEAGWVHTVGLLSNGDVLATGDNAHGQCEVENWHNVIEIAAGGWNTAALTDDGRVLVVGDNEYGQCDIDWSMENIVHIAVGRQFIVGLRADGTVVAAGRNLQNQLNVSQWQDVVMIATGDYHTIGLTDAGKVVSTSFSGSNDYGQYLTSEWENIIAVYGGARSTVALTTDGTLLVSGLVDADTYAYTGAMQGPAAIFIPSKFR